MTRRHAGGATSPVRYTNVLNPPEGAPRTPEAPTGPATGKWAVLSARLRPGELDEVETAANRRGISRSEWARGVLVVAAHRALEKGAPR
jgi:hypothetical protein